MNGPTDLQRRLTSASPREASPRNGVLVQLKLMVMLIAMIAVALPLASQMATFAQEPQTAALSGVWHPLVGSGGAYEWTVGDDKHPLETTIVGKEDVDGKAGYWLETVLTNPKAGELYYKALMVVTDGGVVSTRTIVQRPGQGPMEMDTNKTAPAQRTRPIDMRAQADLVGTETITVPAGTFTCEHYRAKDGSSDVWVSDKISPWGLVKTQNKTSSMVLTKVITDAQDRITGTPQKFDPAQRRDRRGQQPQ